MIETSQPEYGRANILLSNDGLLKAVHWGCPQLRWALASSVNQRSGETNTRAFIATERAAAALERTREKLPSVTRMSRCPTQKLGKFAPLFRRKRPSRAAIELVWDSPHLTPN